MTTEIKSQRAEVWVCWGCIMKPTALSKRQGQKHGVLFCFRPCLVLSAFGLFHIVEMLYWSRKTVQWLCSREADASFGGVCSTNQDGLNDEASAGQHVSICPREWLWWGEHRGFGHPPLIRGIVCLHPQNIHSEDALRRKGSNYGRTVMLFSSSSCSREIYSPFSSKPRLHVCLKEKD